MHFSLFSFESMKINEELIDVCLILARHLFQIWKTDNVLDEEEYEDIFNTIDPFQAFFVQKFTMRRKFRKKNKKMPPNEYLKCTSSLKKKFDKTVQEIVSSFDNFKKLENFFQKLVYKFIFLCSSVKINEKNNVNIEYWDKLLEKFFPKWQNIILDTIVENQLLKKIYIDHTLIIRVSKYARQYFNYLSKTNPTLINYLLKDNAIKNITYPFKENYRIHSDALVIGLNHNVINRECLFLQTCFKDEFKCLEVHRRKYITRVDNYLKSLHFYCWDIHLNKIIIDYMGFEFLQ